MKALLLLLFAFPAHAEVWDRAAGEFIADAVFYDRIASANIVVLGEYHGLAVHQKAEADVLYELMERDVYPGLALEMLKPKQLPGLTTYRQENPDYADRLGNALQWSDSGWPAFHFYAPVFQAAFIGRLPILSADVEPSKLDDLIADVPKEGEHFAYWQDVMTRAHCGLLDGGGLARRAAVQVLRDQNFIATTRKGAPVVLIAGRNHLQVFDRELSDAVTVYLGLQGETPKASHADYFWALEGIPRRNPCDLISGK